MLGIKEGKLAHHGRIEFVTLPNSKQGKGLITLLLCRKCARLGSMNDLAKAECAPLPAAAGKRARKLERYKQLLEEDHTAEEAKRGIKVVLEAMDVVRRQDGSRVEDQAEEPSASTAKNHVYQ